MVRLADGFATCRRRDFMKLLNLTKVYFQEVYSRVILVVGQLGWVDLDLGVPRPG